MDDSHIFEVINPTTPEDVAAFIEAMTVEEYVSLAHEIESSPSTLSIPLRKLQVDTTTEGK